ncbi:MAG: hypothetical protein ACP5M4_10520 [Acidobacteriaceae bacterium]
MHTSHCIWNSSAQWTKQVRHHRPAASSGTLSPPYHPGIPQEQSVLGGPGPTRDEYARFLATSSSQVIVWDGPANGHRILPAYYSNNYVVLLPGESQTVTILIPTHGRHFRPTPHPPRLEPHPAHHPRYPSITPHPALP